MTYPLTTFPTIITNPDGTTAGVPIPGPPYTDAEKEVIQLALDGESLFENPVEGPIENAIGALGVLAGRLFFLNGDDGDPVTPTPNYSPLYGLLGDLISDVALISSQLSDLFRPHTARISGASGGEFYDEPDGELYGFNALQGIASAYNSAKDAMRAEDDPVVDNYSIHFSAILSSGQNLVNDIISFAGRNGLSINGLFLGFTPRDDGSYDFDPSRVELTASDISGLESLAEGYEFWQRAVVNRDNKALSDSVEYLEKYSRGNMVLAMNKDEYFGGKLLKEIETDELADKLADVEII